MTTASALNPLARLNSQPRQPGEASFFWYDTQFKCEAVKVLPGEYFVDTVDLLITTTLGSCIAACLWDARARVGGMNHFMLPGGHADSGAAQMGRYGAYAMELLINEMMRRGACRHSLEAKVFGGGQVVSGMDTINVGERNTQFVLSYLKAERIPVVSQDVQGVVGRKVCFFPASGKALVKRLASTHNDTVLAQERVAARAALAPAGAGSVELF